MDAGSGGATGSNFATRCASPGVIRCEGLDQLPTLVTSSTVTPVPTGTLAGYSTTAVVDPSIKASGTGSLKFTIPSNSLAGAAGSVFYNFSNDYSNQIGASSDVYVQWRQRFSPEFLSYQAGGDGWNQAIIGTGSLPGQPAYTCTDLGVVTQNASYRGFAQMYDSCSGSTSHGPSDPFDEPFGASDSKLENARPSPYCLYSQGKTTPPSLFPPAGNCFAYVPNEWMTFQIHIQTGPRVADEFVGSHVQLWVARENHPAELVIDWGPYNLSAGAPANDEKFGQVWFLPYDTNSNTSIAHPTAYTWYDELIISRARIADP
jgi:hypothetical protein